MRLSPQTPLTEMLEIGLFMLVFYLQQRILYQILLHLRKWWFVAFIPTLKHWVFSRYFYKLGYSIEKALTMPKRETHSNK